MAVALPVEDADADAVAVGDVSEDAVALAVADRDGLGQSCHDTMTAPETPSHPSLASPQLPLPPLPKAVGELPVVPPPIEKLLFVPVALVHERPGAGDTPALVP